MTDIQIKQVEELAKDLTIEQVANYLNITEAEFNVFALNDSRIMKAYKRGRSAGIKDAVELLWKSMKQGNLAAISCYLNFSAGWAKVKEEQTVGIQTVLTPEQQEEKDKQVKLFTQWKKEKGFE
jgi:hypothetical protein